MSLLSRINVVKKLLTSRKFRDAYVYEHVRNGIPFQIRTLRKDRNWSQLELAEAAKTSRTVITRIEDPNYGKLTLKTLLQIASAFNVALLIKFVPFSRLVREYEDVSWQALGVKSIADAEETANLQSWALEAASQPLISQRGTGKLAHFAPRFDTASNMGIRSFKGDPAQSRFNFMDQPQLPRITVEDFKRVNYDPATYGFDVRSVEFVSKNVEETKAAA